MRFLRGRALPEQAVLKLQAWLAAAPETRWLIAGELEWPTQPAADLAVSVRAMAAAMALRETSAFDGLAARTAERWLSSATAEGWVSAARALLTQP